VADGSDGEKCGWDTNAFRVLRGEETLLVTNSARRLPTLVVVPATRRYLDHTTDRCGGVLHKQELADCFWLGWAAVQMRLYLCLLRCRTHNTGLACNYSVFSSS
jgi:hypothetical protein